MRSLVVARWSIGAPTSGAQHRSANVVAALAELGDVDMFLLANPRTVPEPPPAALGLRRVGHVVRTEPQVRRLDRWVTIAPGTSPAVIRRRDDGEARAAFSSWLTHDYDLVWFVRIESWLALGSLIAAPAIIDYDDLRDQLVASRRRSVWPDPPAATRGDTAARRWLRGRLTRADIAAWSRLQRRLARRVGAVIVCCELDRARLGVHNAEIVPNGTDIPASPVGRRRVGTPPTLMLHGSLAYSPNADAATVLVRDVAPRVRAEVPDAVVRLVGRADGRVDRLDTEPGVVVTGQVPNITDELSIADVVAVPLRQGAGTRIKVLEAMAHRVPVVATSIAVEGLDVIHGRHLLVADQPDSFASACVSVLRDGELRTRLADAGEQLVREQYGWEHARRAVARVATEVAGSSARPPVSRPARH